MKTKKFKTVWNTDEFPPGVTQVKDRISKTVPDQTLSIRQIQDRFARGLPLDKVGKEFFEVDEDGNGEVAPNVRHLDKADQMLFLEQVKTNIVELRQLLKEEQKEAAYQKKKAADQGPKVQRTTGDEVDQSEEDQPAPQYPKKTRGAGAAPRDTRRRSGGEYEE